MFNSQFYPTPKDVIEIMYNKMGELFNHDKFLEDHGYLWNYGKTILEPSAGKGDIIKYLMANERKTRRTMYGGLGSQYLAVEVEPELRSILNDIDGVELVGTNFLEDFLPIFPDAIMMNPPFNKGAQHFLRAYELLGTGCMVCLLSAATVDNPNTNEKKRLLDIVQKEGGEIVRLGNCFANSERHTNVEVVMVALSKETEREFDFSDNFETESYEERKTFDECTNQIEFTNLFSLREAKYKSVIDSFIQAKKAAEEFKSKLSEVAYNRDNIDDLTMNLKGFVNKLNHSAWQKILDESKFDTYLTTNVKKNFLENGFKRQQKIAFNQSNMWELFSILIQNQSNIMDNCIIEVFDYLTKYHDENREHIEGWKTNDYYKVNMKFILPNLVKSDSYGFSMGCYDYRATYTDIDKILCYLTGQKYEKQYDEDGNLIAGITNIREALEKRFKEMKETGCTKKKAESTFFKLKFYKKGTVHFEFKDKKLWEYFNLKAGELKGFPLPKGKTNYQDMRKYKGGNEFLNRIG
jgi:hypothetical protein